MTSFTLNGQMVDTDAAPDTPLLWVVREQFGLMGSKFGCGAGLCGACTMHVDGEATRTCILSVGDVEGAGITTIEGLGTPDNLHIVQEAWLEHNVPQCGYCQSGQIMSAASLLSSNPDPSDDEIKEAMAGNICRCGTYPRIRAAIKTAAQRMKAEG